MFFNGILLHLSLLLLNGYCAQTPSPAAELQYLDFATSTSEESIDGNVILLVLDALECDLLSPIASPPSRTTVQGERRLKEALGQIMRALSTLPGSCGELSDSNAKEQIPAATSYCKNAVSSLFSYSWKYLNPKHELMQREAVPLVTRYRILLGLYRKLFNLVLLALQEYRDTVEKIRSIRDHFFELRDKHTFAMSEVSKSETVPSRRLFKKANYKKLRLCKAALEAYKPECVNSKAMDLAIVAHFQLTSFKALLTLLLQKQEAVEEQEKVLHERGLLDSSYVSTWNVVRNACRNVLFCEIHKQILGKKGFDKLILENNRPEIGSTTSFFTELSSLLIEAKCIKWELNASKELEPMAPTCGAAGPSCASAENPATNPPSDELKNIVDGLNFRSKIAVYSILLAYGALSDRDANWMDGHFTRIADFVFQEMSNLAETRRLLEARRVSIQQGCNWILTC